MTSKEFAKKYDRLNGEQQEKIEIIFSEYGLSSVFENDFEKAFDALPKDVQIRIVSIIS